MPAPTSRQGVSVALGTLTAEDPTASPTGWQRDELSEGRADQGTFDPLLRLDGREHCIEAN